MKKEHFMHVSEHFNLGQYNRNNSYWKEDLDPRVSVSEIIIKRDRLVYNKYTVFGCLPQNLVSEVLEYLKATEILFV